MREALLDALSSGAEETHKGYAVAPGLVTNNLDALGEGRVQVQIPSLPDF